MVNVELEQLRKALAEATKDKNATKDLLAQQIFDNDHNLKVLSMQCDADFG